MSSKSKSQQRFMGMVHAYQKGELKTKGMDKELLDKIKNAAKGLTKKDAKDFAETKHKGLPEKVKENVITNFYEFIKEESKNIGKEIRKDISKRQREEQLKSGADLRTRVVPDKKKKYNRKKEKKVDLDDQD